jgi:hypothetical protein
LRAPRLLLRGTLDIRFEHAVQAVPCRQADADRRRVFEEVLDPDEIEQRGLPRRVVFDKEIEVAVARASSRTVEPNK